MLNIRLVSAFPNYILSNHSNDLTKLLGIFMTNLGTNFSFMLKWTFLLLLLSLSKKDQLS